MDVNPLGVVMWGNNNTFLLLLLRSNIPMKNKRRINCTYTSGQRGPCNHLRGVAASHKRWMLNLDVRQRCGIDQGSICAVAACPQKVCGRQGRIYGNRRTKQSLSWDTQHGLIKSDTISPQRQQHTASAATTECPEKLNWAWTRERAHGTSVENNGLVTLAHLARMLNEQVRG